MKDEFSEEFEKFEKDFIAHIHGVGDMLSNYTGGAELLEELIKDLEASTDLHEVLDSLGKVLAQLADKISSKVN